MYPLYLIMDTFPSIEMVNTSKSTSSGNTEIVSEDGKANDFAVTNRNTVTINGWTKKLDNLLAEWGSACTNRAMCHLSDKRYYSKKDMYIFFPSIILSTLSSIIAFSLTNFDLQIFSVVAGILSILGILVSSINKYFDFKGMSVKHAFYYKAFSEISSELRIVHALERQNRPEGIVYIRKAKLRIDRLTEKAPTVRQLDMREMILQMV